MKFKKLFLLLVVISISLSYSSLFARPRSNVDQDMYITVEKVSSKSKPSIWGSENDVFYYGEMIHVIDERNGWCRVESDTTGKEGWVKDSVLTKKKIRKQGQISLNAKELALAGKGFSSPLEAEYSNKYKKNFDVVDEMEKNAVPVDGNLKAFIREGKLRGED